MVERKPIRGLFALVAIGLLVPMMMMMITVGMVGRSDMNMRSLSVMADRIDNRVRVGKRISHRQERNNQNGQKSLQTKPPECFYDSPPLLFHKGYFIQP